MNILKKFFLNNKDRSADQRILIPSGQLFLVRSPSSPKSESECLYDDVVVSIRETSSRYNYQVVVGKGGPAAEELSDDELDEANDSEPLFESDANNIKSFLIDEQLKFCLFHDYEREVIAWKDTEGDVGDMYEYRVNPTVAQDTIDEFVLAIYKCEYERKYSKSSVQVHAESLEEFVVDRSDLQLGGGDRILSSISTASSRLMRVPEPESSGVSSDDEFQDAQELNGRAGELLGTVDCQLYVYEPAKGTFKTLCAQASAKVLDLGGWDYWLEVQDTSSATVPVVATDVQDDMDAAFRFDALSFVFNFDTGKGAVSYLVKFATAADYDKFQTLYARAVFEHKSRVKWSKVKPADQDYLTDMFNNLDLSDDELADVYDDEDPEISEDNEEVSEEDDDEGEKFADKSQTEHNTSLKMALMNDRAFVTRGNRLGVFTTDGKDKGLEFATTIENLSSSKDKKKRVNPAKMMLQNGDTTMVVQDNDDPNTLYKLDLTRGQVVEDWKLTKDTVEIPVVNFAPNDKYAELTAEQTFVGLGSQSLFKVDPRTQAKIVDTEFKSYATKQGFNQIATTEDGYIAASTRNGEIKLYNALGKNAKTALPGLGDEFLGLATSNDGRFLLATCKTYLLLIDVQIKQGTNRYKLGFEKSFPKVNKPLPKKLALKPEHLAYLRQTCGADLSFTKANFNASVSTRAKNPTSIITSVGPFAITWNLRKVLRNDPDPYTIRKYSDTVIMSDFTPHNLHRMVLTLPNDVTAASSSTFRSPTKGFGVVDEY